MSLLGEEQRPDLRERRKSSLARASLTQYFTEKQNGYLQRGLSELRHKDFVSATNVFFAHKRAGKHCCGSILRNVSAKNISSFCEGVNEPFNGSVRAFYICKSSSAKQQRQMTKLPMTGRALNFSYLKCPPKICLKRLPSYGISVLTPKVKLSRRIYPFAYSHKRFIILHENAILKIMN